MPLVAAAPFAVPEDLRPLARDVFSVLAKVRFVSVTSLVSAMGPSGLTGDLLDDWIRAGFLHLGAVRLDPLAGPEVRYVALAPFGTRTLAAATGLFAAPVTSARLKRSSQKRAHDLGVGEVALACLVLHRACVIELAGLETDDKKFATSQVIVSPGTAPVRVALQADLYLLVRENSQDRAYLIELDRGTISPKKMTEKYAAYLAWSRDGGPSRDFGVKALRVLTVVPDRRRLDTLHAGALAANEGHRSGFLLFALAEDLRADDAERLMGPIARPLGDDARVPLFTRASGDRGTS